MYVPKVEQNIIRKVQCCFYQDESLRYLQNVQEKTSGCYVYYNKIALQNPFSLSFRTISPVFNLNKKQNPKSLRRNIKFKLV